MTSSYSHCDRIEALGVKLIMPLLKSKGKVARIEGERAQREHGDYTITGDVEQFHLELKTEEFFEKNGNLFLEIWSNRVPGKHERPGWMETLESDWIAFLFLDCKRSFWFDFKALRKWVKYDMNLTDWAVRQAGMSKRGEQKNNTWGYCVPAGYLMSILELRGESYRVANGEWRQDRIATPMPPSESKDIWSGFIEGEK